MRRSSKSIVLPLVVVGLTALIALPLRAAGLRGYVWERLEPTAWEPMAPPSGVGSLSATACGACHVEIAAEWRISMMGQAMTDPIFTADHQGGSHLFWCLRCHAPLAEQQPEVVSGLAGLRPLQAKSVANPDFDAALQAEGVTCVACHLRDGALVGGIEDPVGAPHPTAVDRDWVGGEACGRCHQLAAPPLSRLDRPLADVMGEWEEWKAETGRTESCADCHMPRIERPVVAGGLVRAGHQHNFAGGWDDDMVRSGVTVVDIARVEAGVVVRLRNEAGHRNPTNDPARALVVRVRPHTASGPGEATEVVLSRLIPLPKVRDAGDTTLGPGETRSVLVAFPPGALAASTGASVQVIYERLRFLTEVADRAGVPEAARAVTIASQELRW